MLILLAYIFVSFEVIRTADFAYQALNLVGALGLGYISFKKKAYQPGVLNAVWAVVAVMAIVNIVL